MLSGSHAEFDETRARKLARSGFVRIIDRPESEVVTEAYSADEDDEIQNEETETTEKEEVINEKEKVEIDPPAKHETNKPKGKPGRKPNRK